MRRWIGFTSPLVMILVLTSFDLDNNLRVPESLRFSNTPEAAFPQPLEQLPPESDPPPFTGLGYIGFREALAHKESRGNYLSVNTFGYLGKYQFGKGTLKLMGIHDTIQFLNDPELQEKVFITNISRNKWILRRDIARFSGKRIHGIVITESGMVAAAHLAGAGNVKKFLRSWGEFDAEDAFGSSISHYLRKFRGYDLTMIPAKRNPQLSDY
ncbi:MAG: hypothetical protein RLZZ241_2449 [Bacteroidota bacterium]|jgi:hypothetical protein